MTGKPNDKQKEESPVFCENCRYYADDVEKCGFEKGTKITPVEIADIYASPEKDNKHNDCRYYKENEQCSGMERIEVLVFLTSLLLLILFKDIIWLLLAMGLFIRWVWRAS